MAHTVSERFIPAALVHRITGLSPRAVHELIRQGVFHTVQVGRGRDRLYTAHEVVELAVAARLASVGVKPLDVKLVLPLIRDWPDRVLRAAPEAEYQATDPVVIIAADAVGNRVAFIDTVAGVADVINQAQAFTVLRLGSLVRSVRAALAEAAKDAPRGA